MSLIEPFCIRLQRIMAERDITQSELARMLHVSRTCVHHWYWGINEPNIEKLHEMRRALRCDWEELMGR